jgi:ribosome maturation factor RimP
LCYNTNRKEWRNPLYYYFLEVVMREKINNLVKEEIDKLNISISDVNIEKVEGKNVLNIELDCEETIDLNKITEASTIINQLIDKEENILKENDIDEVDIYSKEKGGEDE